MRKHKIEFAQAATVLTDDLALTVSDDSGGEERYVTMGVDAVGRLVVVVYVWRGDTIRLISARRATRRERKQYEGNR